MRFRRLLLIAAATGLLAGCSTSTTPKPAGSTTSAIATRPSTSVTTTPKPKHSTATPSTAEIKAAVTRKIDAIVKSEPSGGVSVAALNTVTGAAFSAGATSGMWTASSYKLLMLVTVLLRNGGTLSDSEQASATRAIENSDNVAGYALFLDAGGRSGVQSALDTLHMSHTVPGNSDPTFTTTSGSDYLKLLKALTSSSPLSKSARSLVLGLMRQVETDQRWGVGVVADKGTTFANKNGWLSIDDSNGPGETDNGLWAVTSVGVVTVDHQQVLMSVFTRHQKSFASGVALVQKLARTMVPAVSG